MFLNERSLLLIRSIHSQACGIDPSNLSSVVVWQYVCELLVMNHHSNLNNLRLLQEFLGKPIIWPTLGLQGHQDRLQLGCNSPRQFQTHPQTNGSHPVRRDMGHLTCRPGLWHA